MGTAPRRAPFETPARRLVEPGVSGGRERLRILALTAAAVASSAAWLAHWGAVMLNTKHCLTLIFYSENVRLKLDAEPTVEPITVVR